LSLESGGLFDIPEERLRRGIDEELRQWIVSFRQQRMIFWNNHALLPKAYIHFVTPRHRKETKLTL
jgi:hypothetical protein